MIESALCLFPAFLSLFLSSAVQVHAQKATATGSGHELSQGIFVENVKTREYETCRILKPAECMMTVGLREKCEAYKNEGRKYTRQIIGSLNELGTVCRCLCINLCG
jgi:hypothetical protein